MYGCNDSGGGNFNEYSARKAIAVCGIVCGGYERNRLHQRICGKCCRLYSRRKLYRRRYRYIGSAFRCCHPYDSFTQKISRVRDSIGCHGGRLCLCGEFSHIIYRKRGDELHYSFGHGRRRCGCRFTLVTACRKA